MPAKRYLHLDRYFFHKDLCHNLLKEFGPWGPILWIAVLSEAKDGTPIGTFTYHSQASGLLQMGVDVDDTDIDLAAFFTWLGRRHYTRRTSSGRTSNIEILRFYEWQTEGKRADDRIRKTRVRHESGADNGRTPPGTDTGQKSALELELELELEDSLEKGPKAAPVPAPARGTPQDEEPDATELVGPTPQAILGRKALGLPITPAQRATLQAAGIDPDAPAEEPKP